MPIKWEQESADMVAARKSGKLVHSEMKECQAAISPIIQSHGNMRLLVVLENFSGWEGNKGWDDTSFPDANDEHLARFACVGDEKWRDQMLMFVLAGLRPVDIRYFPPDQEATARKWLAEG